MRYFVVRLKWRELFGHTEPLKDKFVVLTYLKKKISCVLRCFFIPFFNRRARFWVLKPFQTYFNLTGGFFFGFTSVMTLAGSGLSGVTALRICVVTGGGDWHLDKLGPPLAMPAKIIINIHVFFDYTRNVSTFFFFFLYRFHTL